MTGHKPNPPGLALWLLRHTYPRKQEEALAGDLIERFREGRTRGWFWKQALIATAVVALGSIRRRWPLFCYAIAGAIAMGSLRHAYPLRQVPVSLHWSDLPWPVSQIVLELSGTAILTLISLLILAVGLEIAGAFHWASLLRTWIINFMLIAIGHYSIDLFPWLLRPDPGEPYHKILVVPGALQLTLLVSAFLVAAWLGCPMEDADEYEERTAVPQ